MSTPTQPVTGQPQPVPAPAPTRKFWTKGKIIVAAVLALVLLPVLVVAAMLGIGWLNFRQEGAAKMDPVTPPPAAAFVDAGYAQGVRQLELGEKQYLGRDASGKVMVMLTPGATKTVELVDVATGKAVGSIPKPMACGETTPDGTLVCVVSTADQGPRLMGFDATTGTEKWRVEVPGRSAADLSVTTGPEGDVLAAITMYDFGRGADKALIRLDRAGKPVWVTEHPVDLDPRDCWVTATQSLICRTHPVYRSWSWADGKEREGTFDAGQDTVRPTSDGLALSNFNVPTRFLDGSFKEITSVKYDADFVPSPVHTEPRPLYSSAEYTRNEATNIINAKGEKVGWEGLKDFTANDGTKHTAERVLGVTADGANVAYLDAGQLHLTGLGKGGSDTVLGATGNYVRVHDGLLVGESSSGKPVLFLPGR